MSAVCFWLDNTRTHRVIFCLSHLKTLLEGHTKEDQGLSQSQGNEPAFSLMTFTENIMGNSERTERLADYSSARIHAFAAWLMHDGIWQLDLAALFQQVKQRWSLLLWEWGWCRPYGFVVLWKPDSRFNQLSCVWLTMFTILSGGTCVKISYVKNSH